MTAPWRRPAEPLSEQPAPETRADTAAERRQRKLEYLRRWREANREKQREQRRQHRGQNHAQVRAREAEATARWRERNPEKLIARSAHRQEDPEKKRERFRRYYAKNVERERERGRLYRAAMKAIALPQGEE